MGARRLRDYSCSRLRLGARTLPRYFFSVFDGVDIPDWEGTECANLVAARATAIRTSGEMIRDLGEKFWEDQEDWRMEVTDAGGVHQFTLRFSPR